MLPFDIMICGEPEISCVLNGHTHAVSIMDPGQRAAFPESLPETSILRLNFHDLGGMPPAGDPGRLVLESRGHGIVLPDVSHVRAILAFGQELPDGARVLIHCMAGISRSTAAAFILACQARPGREAEWLDHIRRIRPQAQPNRLMVVLADELLGAGGRMIEARG